MVVTNDVSRTANVEKRQPVGARPGGRRRRRAAHLVVTLASVAVVLAFVPPYLSLNPDGSRVGIRDDVPFQFPVLVVHVVCAGLALLIGPVQFSARLRARAPRVHRVVGRVYVFAGILPGALAGIVVAVLTTAGPLAAISFVLIDVIWVGTVVAGVRAARQRRYADHRRWMTRNFAMTFAAVTLRSWLAVLILVQLPLRTSVYHGDFDALFHVAYVSSSWLAWVPNLLFIEWYLRRRRTGSRRADRAGVPVAG